MNAEQLYHRYHELQRYVGWSEADRAAIAALRASLLPRLPAMVDDFYAEIDRHPAARRVITGGAAQIERLKGTLHRWLTDLLTGPYDRQYVERRWRVGQKHVEIGLEQVFTNAALSRLRHSLLQTLLDHPALAMPVADAVSALNRLLDLDLAIIEDAYQTAFAERLQQTERQTAQLQQQQLELARQRSEAALGTLLQTVPCLIIIMRPDHTILSLNRFGEAMTGFGAEEVLGRNYFDVFLPAAWHGAVANHIRDVLGGKASPGFENNILCKDGSQRATIWNVQRLDHYEGGLAVLALGQDISALKKAQEHALQSARLAAMGQMMTVLAHESGNALARSQAALEMLALELNDAHADAQEYIANTQKALDHLRQLYEEVRAYASPLRLDREAWDLALIWRQAWSHLALQRQGKDAQLVEEVEGVDCTCSVDSFRLEQVFRNIFDNALAACGKAPRLTLRAADMKVDNKPALRITIKDNGPGLNAEQRQHIFEPFYTTKSKGTGLGMAIVQRVIEAHGGTIMVGNTGHPGAELVITLPRER